MLLQLRNAELEAELDALRDEANRRIRELEGGNQEQAQAAQQQGQELQARRREVTTLEAKLQSRSGVLADHSERAKQLQQVGPLLLATYAACHHMQQVCPLALAELLHVITCNRSASWSLQNVLHLITCKAVQLGITRRQQHGHSQQLTWLRSCISADNFEQAKQLEQVHLLSALCALFNGV